MQDNNHYDQLVKQIAHSLRRRCGVEEGSHVLVAVSGGADSVALLRALEALKARRRWRLTLTVGHVQHHLRDQDAEADAGFVDELARQLKLPGLRRDLDLSDATGNLEDEARQARYAALGKMAQECGASFIATGHHGDDQLETLLMRILRGAGTAGMRGIPWQRKHGGTENREQGSDRDANVTDAEPDRSPTIVRPMLAATSADIAAYLHALGQDYRHDHTNADTTRWRARLRAEVLPTLEAIRPGAGSKATVFADHLREVHDVLGDAIEHALRLVEPQHDGVQLDRQACRQLRPVVLSGLLRSLLFDAGVPRDALNAQQLGRIVTAIRDHEGGHRRFPLAGHVSLKLSREHVTVHHS